MLPLSDVSLKIALTFDDLYVGTWEDNGNLTNCSP